MARLSVDTWWRAGTVLYALFVVALISVPSDTGLGTPIGVISPSRVLLVVALAVVGIETIRGHEGRVVPGIGLLVAWSLFLGLAMASTATGAFGPRWSRFASLVLEGFGVFWLSWMVAQRSAARAQTVIVFATAAVAASPRPWLFWVSATTRCSMGRRVRAIYASGWFDNRRLSTRLCSTASGW